MKISSAYIEIVNICNLDCSTCYNRSGKTRTRQELSFDDFVQITDRLTHEFGCTRILISGGEPTLHNEFDRILSHLLSTGLEIGVVTNGTTNNQSLVTAYLTQKKLTVQVSLDGSCEQINAKTRGRGNFNKTAEYLSRLSAAGRHPFLRMVVSQNNLHDVEAYYRFAFSIGCIPDYTFINDMGNASDIWETLAPTPQQKLSVLRTLERLNEECEQSVQLPLCTVRCPLAISTEPLDVLVKSDATMLPCQALYDKAFALGNLLSDSTSVMEQNLLSLATIAQHRETSNGKCAKCLARVQCRKGCMAMALMKYQDANADDGECQFRKLQLLGHDIKQLTVID